MSPLLLLVFVGMTVGQPHGPGEDSVMCYDCHGPHGHIPECLNHVKMCHGDEVCQIKYGGHEPEIDCHRKPDCEHEVNDAAHQCSTGGARVHDSCQICCSDAQCLTDSVALATNTSLTAGQPHGPGEDSVMCYDCHGPQGHFPECLNHVKMCHGDEVCQIKYGGHETEIDCHRKPDCEREVNDAAHQCSTGGARVHDSCQICCNDAQCLNDFVALETSTTTGPAMTDMPSTIPPDVTVQGTDMTAHSACEDTIQLMTCADVEDVCSSPLLVDYCKKYCGLC